MATRAKSGVRRPLDGEDINTTHWEDAHHWLSIYADLLEFKRGLLGRVRSDVAALHPTARKAAEVDVRIIEDQMQGYQVRIDLWYTRLWELHGFRLDPASRLIRHQGVEVALTNREFQLLDFLLNHPHRYFTTESILVEAWSGAALFPEEVRNYIQRLRKILVNLNIPAEIDNQKSRGYSLLFRPDRGSPP